MVCVSAGINFEMGCTFGQVKICSDRHGEYNFVKMFTLTRNYPTPPLRKPRYNTTLGRQDFLEKAG